MSVNPDLLRRTPALPADALVFSFPRSLRWLMLFGAVFFFGFLILALTLPWIDPAHSSRAIVFIGIGVFGSFGSLCIRQFIQARRSVAVSSEGVWDLSPGCEPRFLAWHDVAQLKADDVQQRLVLLDGTRTKSIKLDYHLEGFGQLREFVLHHTAESARNLSAGESVFHRSLINKAFFSASIIFLLALGKVSLNQNDRLAAIVFIGAAGVALFLVLRDPSTLVIAGDSVIIKSPGWRQTIRFETISNIDLTDEHGQYGNVWATIVLKRNGGKPIKLYRFREGSLALHIALQTAWRSAGGGRNNA